MPKSKLTGKGKKVLARENEEYSRGKTTRKRAVEGQAEYLPGGKASAKLERAIDRYQRHLDEQFGEKGSAYKDLKFQKPDFAKSLKQGYGIAQDVLKPEIEAAQRNFSQSTAPQLLQQYGQGGKSSSALNQALSGAAGNLNTDIQARLNELALGYGQNIGEMNLQENARQQDLQFRQNSQRMAGQRTNLDSQLAAAAQRYGVPLATLQQLTGLAREQGATVLGTNPYVQQERGPSIGSQLAGAGLTALGGLAGSFLGPIGTSLGTAAGGALSSALFKPKTSSTGIF